MKTVNKILVSAALLVAGASAHAQSMGISPQCAANMLAGIDCPEAHRAPPVTQQYYAPPAPPMPTQYVPHNFCLAVAQMAVDMAADARSGASRDTVMSDAEDFIEAHGMDEVERSWFIGAAKTGFARSKQNITYAQIYDLVQKDCKANSGSLGQE
jgi:hypothetical protein